MEQFNTDKIMIRHNPSNKTHRIKVTEILLDRLEAPRVLEIGAGDYSFDYVYKERACDWSTIDFAPPCDVTCDLNLEDLLLPFAEDSFELVVCTEVLEHLLWPHKLLAEIYRILTPNGHVLASIPNIASLSYRAAWLCGHLPSCAASGNIPSEFGSTAYKRADNSYIGGHVIDFNSRRFTTLLNFAGFKIQNTKGSGIIWHRQILPYWLVPPSLASNIICVGRKAHLS